MFYLSCLQNKRSWKALVDKQFMPLLFIFRLLSLDEYRHLLGKVQRLFLQVRRRYLTCPMDSLMSRYCSISSIAARAIPMPTTSSNGGAGTDTHRAGGTTAAVQRSSIPTNQPVKGATGHATRKRRRGCRGGKLVQSRKSKENDVTDNSTTAPPESKKRKISVLHTSGSEDHHHHRIKGARAAEEQGQSNSIDRLWMPFKVPELITVGQRLLDQALKSAALLERHKEDTSSSSLCLSSRYMCRTELLGSGDTATGTGPIHTGDSSDCPKREGVDWSGEHLRSHLVRTLFAPELIDTTSGCAVRDSGSDDLTWTSMVPSVHDSMKNDGSMLLLSAPLSYLMSQQDGRLSAHHIYLDSDHSGMKAHTNSSSKSSSKVDATGTISEDLTPFIPNPSLDLMHDTAATVDHRSCQVDADYIHSSNSNSNPRYPSSLSSLKKNKRKKVKRKIRTLRSSDGPQQQQHATTPSANYPPHPHHIEQLERVDSGIAHHLSRPFFTKASDCMDACYECYRFFAYVCYYVILFVELPARYLVVLQQHLIIINIIILIHHTLVPIADKRHHSRYTQRAAGRHPSHTIILPESSRRGVGPAVSGHTQQTCLGLRESCV